MTRRVIVHAGVDTEPSPVVTTALHRASQRALAILERGGDPTRAAVEAVCVLEDEPTLNAGRGSVLNEHGDVEADASVVDGHQQRFAAVAALVGLRNPVAVAHALLLEESGPVFLAGDGAHRFGVAAGVPRAELRTAEQRGIWEHVRSSGLDQGRSVFTGRAIGATETVGAIVTDGGRVAAAASTGGMLMKRQGRVGDSAIHGAGIYADAGAAVLCSGNGEISIELHLALRTALRIADTDVHAATTWAVRAGHERKALRGGVLAYDLRRDAIGVAHNASSFPVLSATPDGHVVVDPTVLPSAPG